jgi:16S rRNA (adenine1518-N6/adenine1519-N6)-dimethyltransferase
MGQRLGQHFLKHRWAASALAQAVPLKAGECFVEVGPGKGVLTRELLKYAPVVAIEKDEALVTLLKEAFANDIASKRLTLIEGDVRDLVTESDKTARDARRGESGDRAVLKRTVRATLRLRNDADGVVLSDGYVVAANIPYYITGEIIRQFLTTPIQPRAMALLIQKEVADRIVARDGKESILSISVKAYGVPRIVERVPRKHFSPPPRVDSAIIAIESISKEFFAGISEERFFAVVRAGFASKRKQLINNLSHAFGREAASAAHAACAIDEKARAEDLTLEEWRALAVRLQ